MNLNGKNVPKLEGCLWKHVGINECHQQMCIYVLTESSIKSSNVEFSYFSICTLW